MKIYLICPVRNASDDKQRLVASYVEKLESEGHVVHYPPRDVRQTDDGVGYAICFAHREAMVGCDEVHIFWDDESRGSLFDFGMAFMLRRLQGFPIRIVNAVKEDSHKSFKNVAMFLTREAEKIDLITSTIRGGVK